MNTLPSIIILGLFLGLLSIGSTVFIYKKMIAQQEYFYKQIEQAEHDFLKDFLAVSEINELEKTESGRKLIPIISKNMTTSSLILNSDSLVSDETYRYSTTEKKSSSQSGKGKQPLQTPTLLARQRLAASASVSIKNKQDIFSQLTWKGKKPNLVGKVMHINYSVSDKQPIAPTFISALLSLIVSPRVSFFTSGKKLKINIRIEEINSEEVTDVTVEAANNNKISIDVGDTISIWGKMRSGVLRVDKMYNYNINSFIPLKR